MTSTKTKSEEVFEDFLSRNQLSFDPIPTAASPRPDYLVTCGPVKIIFEVKELTADENFATEPFKVSSRIVGDHIRRKIADAKKQVQWGTAQGIPSVLLIYNNLDTVFQMFGTEDHDFICAMYGEYTVLLDKATGERRDQFHGRNQSLAEQKNTSFSALGRLSTQRDDIKLTLFENAFAKLPMPYAELPTCFDTRRVNIESSQQRVGQ
jgi:hypothetical protein